MQTTGTVLSSRIARTLAGIAVDQQFLPSEMIESGHEEEDFAALRSMASGTVAQARRDLALQVLLTSSDIVAPLPMYEVAGEAFAFRSAMNYLAYKGVITDVYDPDLEAMHTFNAVTGLSSSSSQLMAELPHFELIAFEFHDFLASEADRTTPAGAASRVPAEEIFGMYAFCFTQHLAHVVFRETCQGRRGWEAKQSAFVRFLNGERSAVADGKWQSAFWKLLQPYAFVVSLATEWANKYETLPIQNYDMPRFKYTRVRPFLHYHGQAEPWIYARARGEVSPVDFVKSAQVGRGSDDARLARVCIELSGKAPTEIGALSLEEVVDLRQEPNLQLVQEALAVIFAEISEPTGKFDVHVIKSALGQIEIIRQKSAGKKYCGMINRILTYGSVPVALVEQLTYGGGLVGFGMGVVGTGLQMADDSNQLGQDRWLVRL